MGDGKKIIFYEIFCQTTHYVLHICLAFPTSVASATLASRRPWNLRIYQAMEAMMAVEAMITVKAVEAMITMKAVKAMELAKRA